MAVNNILRDSEEVMDDDELSGDDIKGPIFMITRTGANPEVTMETDEKDEEGLIEENNEQFVQEEYDLAQNLDQIVSNLDGLDEFRFFAETVRQFNEAHP